MKGAKFILPLFVCASLSTGTALARPAAGEAIQRSETTGVTRLAEATVTETTTRNGVVTEHYSTVIDADDADERVESNANNMTYFLLFAFFALFLIAALAFATRRRRIYDV